MISFTDVFHDLVRRGLTLRIDQDGNLFIYDPQHTAGGGAREGEEEKERSAANRPAAKPEAGTDGARDAMAARDAAAPAARCRRPVLPEAGMPQPLQPPGGAHWRGITWQDVPGHDENIKKLNFSLLKRGLLHGHKDCGGLEGEPLRQKLQELSERNRQNSRTPAARTRLRPKTVNTPRPPPP